MKPATERGSILILVAALAYLVQASAGTDWGPLAFWQRDEAYRRWTGLALTLLLGAQWWVALARRAASAERARVLLRTHRRIGALALPGLFVHATRLGYSYLLVLGLLLVAQVSVGALRPTGADSRALRLREVWVRIHVALAVLLAVGAGFHVWMVFAYS